jgi:putative transposase
MREGAAWLDERTGAALHEFEQFYNGHRPHQGIANARPVHPLPAQIVDPDKIAQPRLRRSHCNGGSAVGVSKAAAVSRW